MPVRSVKIGDIELFPIVTSRFRLDGGSMFGVVPKALWRSKAPADDENRIELNVNALVVRTGGRVVLVEPGMGQKHDEKRRRIYALEDIDAVGALRKVGVEASDV
ncbi:MAG: MBL fold metallo-hydrolase, partial [Candidatus Geothermincolia bacterium]